jgi:putative hemolysin
MKIDKHRFIARLARDEDEIRAAQRLRYRVFVEEGSADTSAENHRRGIEQDAFDAHVEHLVLIDLELPDTGDQNIVGVYRLMRDVKAAEGIGFYSAPEFDLSRLTSSGRSLLELGRSCIAKDYRGGLALRYLWDGVARYVFEHDIEIVFGVASFHETNPGAIAPALSFLHHNHLAPPELRVRAHEPHFVELNLISADDLDRSAAVKQIPALLKSYLRLGGVVGEGAFVDREFSTTDVCLIVDTANIPAAQRREFEALRGQEAE